MASSTDKKYNHISITRNMLSTDLIIPGRRHRETLPAIGLQVREKREPRLWGQESLPCSGNDLAYHFFKPSHMTDAPNVCVTHRHYSNRIENFDTKEQPCSLTPLLLSRCRLNDQRMPLPTQSRLVHDYRIKEPCPELLRNPYFSHRCRFQVFPTSGVDIRDNEYESPHLKPQPPLAKNTEDALLKMRRDLYHTTTYQNNFKPYKKCSDHAIADEPLCASHGTTHPGTFLNCQNICHDCDDAEHNVVRSPCACTETRIRFTHQRQSKFRQRTVTCQLNKRPSDSDMGGSRKRLCSEKSENEITASCNTVTNQQNLEAESNEEEDTTVSDNDEGCDEINEDEAKVIKSKTISNVFFGSAEPSDTNYRNSHCHSDWPAWPLGMDNITNHPPGYPKIKVPNYCMHHNALEHTALVDTPQGGINSLANTPQGEITSLSNTPQGEITSLANTPQGEITSLANTPQGGITSLANTPQGGITHSEPVAKGYCCYKKGECTVYNECCGRINTVVTPLALPASEYDCRDRIKCKNVHLTPKLWMNSRGYPTKSTSKQHLGCFLQRPDFDKINYVDGMCCCVRKELMKEKVELKQSSSITHEKSGKTELLKCPKSGKSELLKRPKSGKIELLKRPKSGKGELMKRPKSGKTKLSAKNRPKSSKSKQRRQGVSYDHKYSAGSKFDRGYKTEAHRQYHVVHSEPLPDLRDACKEGRKHTFAGVNVHLLRG